jgi:hypothetical protein
LHAPVLDLLLHGSSPVTGRSGAGPGDQLAFS